MLRAPRPAGLVPGVFALGLFALACGAPEPTPLRPGTFAFGVFGDGPYRAWEVGRFREVIRDANREDLAWFLHVGDIFWYPCSDKAYHDQLAAMNSIRHPVVYTPGDNEWSDCYEAIAGIYRPLERLDHLRTVFFANPGASLGARPMRVRPQSDDPAFGEFVENLLWVRGGFVFATLHLVGSDNATETFPDRSAADDQEVARRTDAAIAWMTAAFELAHADSMHGVVLAFHAEVGLDRDPEARPGYRDFVDRLEDHAKGFPGPVLVIHGDAHAYRLDHPLRDRLTGDPLPNLTRLETFGSPDIGWIRVVVDSVAGRIVEVDPRLTSRWRLW